jgi:nicotinamide mononucleotide transporter
MNIHILDPIGAALSLLCTYQHTRNKRYAFILAAFATCINLCLYTERGLYGKAILGIIYLIMMFYGWQQWGAKKTEKPIRTLSRQEVTYLSLIAILGFAFFLSVLNQLNSDVAYLDATCTILSLIAQWMLCKRILETWLLWFLVDILVLGLELYKGIPFHALIHVIYLFLAIKGYLHWSNLYVSRSNH